METVESIISIVQGLVITIATIFTSWWAYKRFAHKEKISELKKILNTIEAINFEISMYEMIDDFRDVSHHERFIDLSIELSRAALSSLYIEKNNRKKILQSCSKLINEYKLLSLKKYSDEWGGRFKKFEKTYIKTKKIIYEISEQYL